jgi:DNA-directed RNA polymerase subunit RPC12/RpoP
MARRRTGKETARRVIQCYHCRNRFDVGQKTESTQCPSCNQRVIVADVIVKAIMPVSKVQTCGRIVIQRKGTVNAEFVEAHEGLEVLGGLNARVFSGGAVIIGPKARWNGDCHAPSVEIKPGARIESGRFYVPDHSLGLADLPNRSE